MGVKSREIDEYFIPKPRHSCICVFHQMEMNELFILNNDIIQN